MKDIIITVWQISLENVISSQFFIIIAICWKLSFYILLSCDDIDKQMIQKQLLTKDNNTWFSFIILLHKTMKRCTPMLLFMMLLC